MKNEDLVGFKRVRLPEDDMSLYGSTSRMLSIKYGGCQASCCMSAQCPELFHIQSQSARPRRRDSTLSPIASNKSDTFCNKYVFLWNPKINLELLQRDKSEEWSFFQMYPVFFLMSPILKYGAKDKERVSIQLLAKIVNMMWWLLAVSEDQLCVELACCLCRCRLLSHHSQNHALQDSHQLVAFDQMYQSKYCPQVP